MLVWQAREPPQKFRKKSIFFVKLTAQPLTKDDMDKLVC